MIAYTISQSPVSCCNRQAVSHSIPDKYRVRVEERKSEVESRLPCHHLPHIRHTAGINCDEFAEDGAFDDEVDACSVEYVTTDGEDDGAPHEHPHASHHDHILFHLKHLLYRNQAL
ncbi:uncharacterized protein MONOS_17133 [Monocercomonoides exilis]|uniref:uncharacterized protein n=1 Tax=Monocercomonoides exilis TaxID=2049356 RepID=UPI00355A1467|nr:hypothetical protein MONOS_17133 [Monocercomonoides exilis]